MASLAFGFYEIQFRLGELTTLPQTLLSDGEGDTLHYSSPPRRLLRLVLNASGTKPIWTPQLLKAGAAHKIHSFTSQNMTDFSTRC